MVTSVERRHRGLRRRRKMLAAGRGRVCESIIYSGDHAWGPCTYPATGYQRLNDIYLCGVHARAYLNVEQVVGHV